MISAMFGQFRHARRVKEGNDWRRGCVTAIAARLFPDYPDVVMSASAARDYCEKSPAFEAGFRYGVNMALAAGLPSAIPPDVAPDAPKGAA